MTVSSVTLRHFRNHSRSTWTFSPTCTLISGKNTAGKTNILEALVLLSAGKSFRAIKESDMISWGEEVASVHADILDAGEKTALDVQVTTGHVQGGHAPLKRYLVNSVPRRQIDFVGHVKTVLFWPEDLELIVDSPSVRRRYMDTLLCSVDREYRRFLGSYERGLRQRNRLLSAIRDRKAERSQLLFWDQLLIEAGGYITDARSRLLEEINAATIPQLSYEAAYDKSVISQARLEQYRVEEVASATTLVGPHRDDFLVYEREGGKKLDLARYGSRGQQRLGVLWLKASELLCVTRRSGSTPVLLLDDIFSELDPQHRELVFAIIQQQQTVITSADPETHHELSKIGHTTISL